MNVSLKGMRSGKYLANGRAGICCWMASYDVEGSWIMVASKLKKVVSLAFSMASAM